MDNADARQIKLILSGDRKALAGFYRTNKKKLERFIAGKVANPADVEEILQDTLFVFLDRARDFEGRSSVSTFLYSIAGRKIVDYYRRHRHRPAVFSRLPQLETLVATMVTPEDTLEAEFLQDRIARALRGLLPKYKKALLSKYEDKRSVAEIALALSVSVKSAESILFRARRAFIRAFALS
jgi:RNA polymerase sigma-70 factor (ECF subfamily)